ncbi:carbohydrate kinase family protein [Neobacillus sp. Marseille-QA0830]
MGSQGTIIFGDAFIDYISVDQTNSKFQPFLGGATINVAAGVRRLGVPSYYVTKLGTDEDSHFVERELRKEGVHIDYCVQTVLKRICSVTVYLNEKGDRYFHSYQNPTPDELLSEKELKKEWFQGKRIFYFGSGTLFHDTARNTTEQALKYARDARLFVAFDTNIRLKRWESEEQCRKTIGSFIERADIVKMSDEELCFLLETASVEDGLKRITKWNIPYLFVTMGSEGAIAIHNRKKITVPGRKVKAVDTTGAGDAFMAAILSCFHDQGTPSDDDMLKEYVDFANEKAAMATTKLGAL